MRICYQGMCIIESDLHPDQVFLTVDINVGDVLTKRGEEHRVINKPPLWPFWNVLNSTDSSLLVVLIPVYEDKALNNRTVDNSTTTVLVSSLGLRPATLLDLLHPDV